MVFLSGELEFLIGGLKLAIELKIKDWKRFFKVHEKLLFYFVKNVSFIFSNYIHERFLLKKSFDVLLLIDCFTFLAKLVPKYFFSLNSLNL